MPRNIFRFKETKPKVDKMLNWEVEMDLQVSAGIFQIREVDR